MRRITIQLDMDDDEYFEFLNEEEVGGNIEGWMFGELCQNHGLGFMTTCNVEYIDDE